MLALLGGLCWAQIQIAATQYPEEARIAGLEGTVLVTGTKIARPLGLGLDELAAQTVARYRQENIPADPAETYVVEFTLPEKLSHWHLAGVEFQTPQGVARPTFAQADYPVGPGIGAAAYDEGQLLTVIGRAAAVTLAFDVDERGDPGNFRVVNASEDIWGPQAAMLVRTWRFHPGTRGGIPVVVPCTMSLIWGPADFTSPAVSRQIERIYSPPPQYESALAAVVLLRAEPEYTPEATQARVEGRVVMRVFVDPEGNPADVKVQNTFDLSNGWGPGAALVDNAIAAVKQWHFQPKMLNGNATAYSLTVQTNFQLSGVASTVLDPLVAARTVAKPQIAK